MFQTQFCSNSNILLQIARKCMFQTQFCSKQQYFVVNCTKMYISDTILFKTAIFCCNFTKYCMFQTQFCLKQQYFARKCMFQTQFCSNSNILQRVWFSCTKIFHGEQKWWKYSIASRMKIFSHRAYYYTKMFHGEQKCVFLCRWHTKYVLHKSRWGSGIFYAGCIQMCVLHKSRWGSASTTLFNIVTRQVHNCNLHENIQLRPHENIFTSGALFYKENIKMRPTWKYFHVGCPILLGKY